MNFQNIPRDDLVVKRGFLAKLEALVEFDYSQIEPRLLAYFSAKLGDTSLADVYNRGEDIYRVTAGAILDKKPEDVTKEERQEYGKRVFLSIIYGAGPKKIAETQEIPYAQAKEFYTNFHENLPCVRMISNPPPRNGSYPGYTPGAIERVLKRKGYIETLWGRRLAPGQWEEHKMINKLIQGSAADLMKQALVRVHQWQLEAHPVSHQILSVHDSILFDAIKAELDLLRTKVPELMDEPRLREVLPVEVEMSVSFTSWADKEDYAL